VLGVYRANRTLQLLEVNQLSERVQLVANRVRRPMFRDVDLSEQEAVLKRGYAWRVADDAEGMEAAINQGRALADARSGSRLLKDVKALAAGIEERLHIMKAAQG
jgi:Flp pilus assembly CpaE family ATPase